MSRRDKGLREAAAAAWPDLSRSQRARRLERLERLTLEQAAELGQALDGQALDGPTWQTPVALRQLEAAHREAVELLGEPASLAYASGIMALCVWYQLADERERRRQLRLALDEPIPTPPAAGVSPTPDPAAPGSVRAYNDERTVRTCDHAARELEHWPCPTCGDREVEP